MVRFAKIPARKLIENITAAILTLISHLASVAVLNAAVLIVILLIRQVCPFGTAATGDVKIR